MIRAAIPGCRIGGNGWIVYFVAECVKGADLSLVDEESQKRPAANPESPARERAVICRTYTDAARSPAPSLVD